ncbi:MAG TPA: Gldg family protein [Burkholderiales bacterium]|nr:Gldg family protein [Burkholderiales bacterium]
MKKYETLVYSAVGLAALFLILVAFNYLAGITPLRADLTEGKLYTLSAGTRKLLHGLEAPVKIKLYVSRDESVPVQLRAFSKRVEDIVNELKAVAGKNLVVEIYHPQPDSEEEDAAQLDGIEAQQLPSGDSFYLGAAVSRLERKQTLPVISPQREPLLEYDLVRAIARVSSPQQPVVGVMSALPVLGEAYNPMTRRPSDPWVLANELKREFDVKQVNMSATEIPKDLKVLLLIHPRDVTPQTEYALDQFVLRGGKLIAFVDPYAYFDQLPSVPGMPQQGTSSSLPALFKAWGVEMDPGKVLSDVVYASGGGQRYTPTVLSLNRGAFDRDDVVTSQLETLLYVFGGAFKVKPAEGLKVTDLVSSSPDSMLVDDSVATASGDAATKDFRPGGKSWPLALRLSGKFKTAFPGGPPAAPGSKDKDKKKNASPAQLKGSAHDNSVILVADTDMLADPAAVDVQDVFGRKVVVPSNGNLAFALGMVEQFAAGDDLISLRSRAASFRPLTVVRELEANAQKQYFGKIRELEQEIKSTTDKLQELQKAQGGSAASAQILTAEQQAELDRFRKQVAKTKLELKEVRKNLRRDSESLVFWTKVANIALMPLLVALFGLMVALLRRRRAAGL